jgi:2-C-methyl-D-erythritol 4-phosphate cytidylyltransferase
MNTTTTYAVIVAGGQGQRMQMAIPKQFLPLNEKPILYYTLKAFIDAIPDINIVLVLPQEHISYNNMVLQHFEEIPELQIVAGGATRYESVQNGLECVEDEEAIVFVHDGVRPFVSKALIERCYIAAQEKGSAIPAISAIDSMRIIKQEKSEILDRNIVRIIQTPQTFRAKELLKAFTQSYNEKFTDEASVIEHAGYEVHLVDGEKQNIKITTPEDLYIGEGILKALEQQRDL